MSIKVIGLAAILLTFSLGSAHARPTAIVEVKNESNMNMGPTHAERMILLTKYDLTDFPSWSLEPQETSLFRVNNRNLLSNMISFSINYYENAINGGKKCEFETSNNAQKNPDGSYSYNWTKNAVGTNGAICIATILSTDTSNGEWVVSFTIK